MQLWVNAGGLINLCFIDKSSLVLYRLYLVTWEYPDEKIVLLKNQHELSGYLCFRVNLENFK